MYLQMTARHAWRLRVNIIGLPIIDCFELYVSANYVSAAFNIRSLMELYR